jgi:hypothetical protein
LHLIYTTTLFDERCVLAFTVTMKFKLAMCVLAALTVIFNASGMDRWTALSMLESGDDDSVVGPSGEISRFQIRSELWPGGDPRDSKAALVIAKNVMRARLDQFEQTYKRPATDFEFYVLWNAPAKVSHPTPCVASRAQRFANLVQRDEPRLQATVSPGKITNPS